MSSARAAAAAVITGAAIGILIWRLRPDGDRGGERDAAPVAEPAVVAQLAAWSPPPPARTLTRLAGYVWAAPLTAVGLAVGAVSGAAPRLHEGALLFAGARGPAGRMLRWRGFSASTLGHVIVALDEPSAALLTHELTHVRQAERFGPLFAPLYIAGLVRYGYRQNPFERAAYRAGAAFLAQRDADPGRA